MCHTHSERTCKACTFVWIPHNLIAHSHGCRRHAMLIDMQCIYGYSIEKFDRIMTDWSKGSSSSIESISELLAVLV